VTSTRATAQRFSTDADPPAAREDETRWWATAGLVLAVAVLVQLALVAYLGDRAYTDVMRSVSFGAGVERGVIGIRTHVDNSKTFVGPLLWIRLAEAFGLAGIRAFNVAAFVGVFAIQAAIGRRLFGRRVTLYALALTAFYTGTIRNVVASEPDDMMASVLFARGALVWVAQSRESRPAAGRSAAAGLLMGSAFLFKFWVLIVFGGFALFLATRRDWASLVAAAVAFAVPLLGVTLVDGGASVAGFFGSAKRQSGYSPWAVVVARLFVTGLLPAFVVAGLAAVRRPGFPTAFAFLVPAPYLFYVVVMRDAFAVSFVMMLCLVFWSLPIALLLLESRRLAVGRRLQAVFALYLIAAPLNAWVNLWRDTHTFQIVPGCSSTPIDRSAPRISARCVKD
jgi:hypothetical protein